MTQRPIRFRVWDSSRKQMRYDIEKYAQEMEETAFDIITAGFSDVVVEQLTGLKDKTGKEIYFGDRVKDEGNNVREVIFWRGEVVAKGYDDDYLPVYHNLDSLEVIGNIHES